MTKGASVKLVVDKEKCISCMTCISTHGDFFKMADDGKSEFMESEMSEDEAQDAIANCPVDAISEAK